MVGHLGDVACFSFNGNKIITAGGGGMIVTDNEEWARKASHLTTQSKDHAVEYIHNEVGFNYRLTNIQAALGCAQMEQLGEYIGQKRHIAAAYSGALGKIAGVTTMREASWADSIFWMYTALVDEALYGIDSRELLNRLAVEGIQARPLWQPIDQSPAYASLKPADCPVANTLYRDALSLPCSVGLRPRDVERVVDSIFRQGKGNAG
jgi:dTDP-4-amino-4,6-dideoxygalactose transaminase